MSLILVSSKTYIVQILGNHFNQVKAALRNLSFQVNIMSFSIFDHGGCGPYFHWVILLLFIYFLGLEC